MLKPQDIVILLKLLSMITLSKNNTESLLTQNKLALHLCMSVSEVNVGLNRLIRSKLLGEQDPSERNPRKPKTFLPVQVACEECLIFGVKYFFPPIISEYTVGIPTRYAAPILRNKLIQDQDPIPIWPCVEGTDKGVALLPLYPSVPRSLIQYPDQLFYDLLALIDAIRAGDARERKLAANILQEIIYATK